MGYGLFPITIDRLTKPTALPAGRQVIPSTIDHDIFFACLVGRQANLFFISIYFKWQYWYL